MNKPEWRRLSRALLLTAAALLVCALAPHEAAAGLVPCDDADGAEIAAALARIEGCVDPCGESAEVAAVLETLRSCSSASYQICISRRIDRNVFDRPFGSRERVRTITWNPLLQSELEPACEGDREGRPVLRDPTASLLHELVHAAHECRGLDPGPLEIEAVRIENIYRRSAGLCQRARYGDDPLPPQLVRACSPGRCSCAPPGSAMEARSGEVPRERPSDVGPVELGDDARAANGSGIDPR